MDKLTDIPEATEDTPPTRPNWQFSGRRGNTAQLRTGQPTPLPPQVQATIRRLQQEQGLSSPTVKSAPVAGTPLPRERRAPRTQPGAITTTSIDAVPSINAPALDAFVEQHLIASEDAPMPEPTVADKPAMSDADRKRRAKARAKARAKRAKQIARGKEPTPLEAPAPAGGSKLRQLFQRKQQQPDEAVAAIEPVVTMPEGVAVNLAPPPPPPPPPEFVAAVAPEPIALPEPVAETVVEPEPEVVAGPEVVAEPEVIAEPVVIAEVVAELASELELEPESEAEAEPEVEVVPEFEAEPDVEVEPDVEITAGTTDESNDEAIDLELLAYAVLNDPMGGHDAAEAAVWDLGTVPRFAPIAPDPVVVELVIAEAVEPEEAAIEVPTPSASITLDGHNASFVADVETVVEPVDDVSLRARVKKTSEPMSARRSGSSSDEATVRDRIMQRRSRLEELVGELEQLGH